jgi:asparagine N-glycosylation enzyme membrane subunit Stt3
VPFPAVLAGILLGLYLLAWGSGAYLVAILAVWVVLAALVARPQDTFATARASAIAATIALIIVVALQDPDLFRYDTQVAALAVLLILSLLVLVLADRLMMAIGALAGLAIVAVAVAYAVKPALVSQVLTDLARFQPDATRMAVLEARPLFLYSGNWDWAQPWIFFRTGFYVGAAAAFFLAIDVWRSRRLDHLLILIFTAVSYAATVGQNRFGYYLVPAAALVGGWLCARVLDWGGVPHADNPRPVVKARLPMQREVAIVVVTGLAVAANLVPAALTTTRAGGMPDYWAAAMEWLRTSTPEPFDSPDYYYHRYGATNPPAAYTVMNWWDQGYWLIQAAHRVPVSNPTQGGAGQSAAFLTATDEDRAIAILDVHRARYVMVDWELPFRDAGNGALAGRFQNLADWAGTPTSRFYSLCYSRNSESEPWSPTWLYYEPYYQTMTYRLMVAGGATADAVNSTWVVRKQQRADAAGREFCEVSDAQRYTSADEAKRAAAVRGPEYVAVGRTPWQPAFPVAAVTRLRMVQEFRQPGQGPNESPMVRVFEVNR